MAGKDEENIRALLVSRYNRAFRRVVGEDGMIPIWGPYNIPDEAIISALKNNEPLDIEQYRDKSIPEDAVF